MTESITTTIDLCMKHLPRLTRTAVFLAWTYVVLKIIYKGTEDGLAALNAVDGFATGAYTLMLYWYFKTKAPQDPDDSTGED